MKPVKILIDNKIPFIKGALDEVAEVQYLNGSDINTLNVRDADALIIRTRTICNAELLKNSSVKFIATATIGYDHIDTVFCKEKGIRWTNAPGCNASSVEQYFISALLELITQKNLNLENLTIGVVGIGNVGSKVARVAQTLGMKVLQNDPPRERMEGGTDFVSLERIKKEADIISFHVPLNCEGGDSTFQMANQIFFDELLKPVYLINTSRGQVINESSLLKAIQSDKVKGCILDVWENEPVINPDMVSVTEFATPHIAGYSTDGKAKGSIMSVQALSRFFGLGKDNWTPENLPIPENTSININCKNLSRNEILRKVYSSTYSIAEDDTLLRKDLSRFEALRGAYRVRREPGVFSVKLVNNKYENLAETLINLGFSDVNDN